VKSLWGQGPQYLRTRRAIDISPGFARWLIVAVFVIIGLIFVAGDVGLWRLWRAQKEMKSLNEKIVELERTNELLTTEIGRLQSDAFTIEKVAREKYGYLKPGDRVYRIINLPEHLDRSAAARSLDRGTGNP
jgi:cell division protein FtsB